jgi:hypothetical protein
MGRIVFLVEEASMEEMLRGFLPKVFPYWVEREHWLCVPHEGKSDLEAKHTAQVTGLEGARCALCGVEGSGFRGMRGSQSKAAGNMYRGG